MTGLGALTLRDCLALRERRINSLVVSLEWQLGVFRSTAYLSFFVMSRSRS